MQITCYLLNHSPLLHNTWQEKNDPQRKMQWPTEDHGLANQHYLQVKDKDLRISLVLVRESVLHESATAGQWKCHVTANVTASWLSALTVSEACTLTFLRLKSWGITIYEGMPCMYLNYT